jgi:hypothetical protein
MKAVIRPFHAFLAFFALLNLLQAGLTELTGDEALYWMHWNNLDWGYRDHPPAIAAMIGGGYSLLGGEIGVRLLVVVANFLTVWLLYRLIRPAVWWQMVLLLLSIPVLNLYGFMATPDVPLILFTTVYFVIWKKFLQERSVKNTVGLGLAMAALVWSKYHGVLIILLMLLPQRQLWFNKQFWLSAVLGILLFSPHLIWQIAHDLPTIKFHINDRNSDAMELRHILGYVGGQLLVFNPLLLTAVFLVIFKVRTKDKFDASLKWLIVGLTGLFFLNSFRGRVEPHWTAPAVLAGIYLVMTYSNSLFSNRVWKYGLVVISSLILMVRIGLVIDFIPQLHRDFHRDKSKMQALKTIAGDDPVCFMNSYQNPSLYMFYTGGLAHSINNTAGGKNQFDFWSYNDVIHEKPFVFVASYDAEGFDRITAGKHQFMIRKYSDLPVLHGLTIWTDEWLHHYHPGDTATIEASLINRNNYNIKLNHGKYPIRWYAMFNHKKPNEANAELEIIGMPDSIASLAEVRVRVKFVIPDRPGRNYLFFAGKVADLPPTYQSNKLRVMIAN